MPQKWGEAEFLGTSVPEGFLVPSSYGGMKIGREKWKYSEKSAALSFFFRHKPGMAILCSLRNVRPETLIIAQINLLLSNAISRRRAYI